MQLRLGCGKAGNQFVNARLLIDTIHGAVIVPSAAIQHSPNATFVYVVQQDQVVRAREIKLGAVEGDEASVEKGLDAGEVVAIDGTDKLEPGMKVAARMTRR